MKAYSALINLICRHESVMRTSTKPALRWLSRVRSAGYRVSSRLPPLILPAPRYFG